MIQRRRLLVAAIASFSLLYGLVWFGLVGRGGIGNPYYTAAIFTDLFVTCSTNGAGAFVDVN